MAKIRKIYDDAIKPDGSKQVIYPVTSTRAVYTTSNVTLDKVLSEGYRFGGIVLPTDSPSITDQRVFYGASVPGVYTSFGNIAVDSGEAIFLLYDGEHWEKGIFGGAGYSTLTGFKALASIQDLPREETQFGYLINGHLYVWVGENGDTLDGLYQDCGELRGASAYEVAVRNGYQGTEQEWLNDPIHGIKGISVKSVECIHEAIEDGGTNIWRITLTNGNSTDFEVKNGNQGNSGYQGAAGELEVVNNLVDGGATAALSAEMGKAIVDLYGTYVDNPEFVKVWLDKEDRILMAIRNDGDIYFGVGTPSQVKQYIEERIAELGLQDYEKLVNFVGELIDSPKTLSELFADVNASIDTKVDKEEGKSLIDSEFASAQSHISNPEYIEVKTDSEDKILEGLKTDGTKVIATDLQVGGNLEVQGTVSYQGVTYSVCTSPEYVYALLDSQEKVILGIKTDGKLYADIASLDDTTQALISQVEEMLAQAEQDIDAKIQVLTDIFSLPDNPEWIQVTTDNEGKILEGITAEGKKKVMVETLVEDNLFVEGILDAGGVKRYTVNSPEWKEAILDNKGNVIKGTRIDNTEYNSQKIKEEKQFSLSEVIDLGLTTDIRKYFDVTEEKRTTVPRAPLALMEPGQPYGPRIEDPSLPPEQQRTIVGYRRCRMPAITLIDDKIVVSVCGYLDGWKEKYDAAVAAGWTPPPTDDWRWDDFGDCENYIVVFDLNFNVVHSQIIPGIDLENYEYCSTGQPVFVQDSKAKKTYMVFSTDNYNVWHNHDSGDSFVFVYSTEDGINWVLETKFSGTNTIAGYKNIYTTASKGLRLPNGHLIIPCYTAGGDSPVNHRSGYIELNPDNWNDFSYNFVTNDLLTNECTAFFSPDGNIVISSRSGFTDDELGGHSTRIIQQYKDGKWEPYWGDKLLYPICSCQESWVRGLQTNPSPNSRVIFRSACANPSLRKNMSLWASIDECISFYPIFTFDYTQLFNGYSDIIGDGENSVYVTYEEGYWGEENNNVLSKVNIKIN